MDDGPPASDLVQHAVYTDVHTGGELMKTAKVFRSGNSQAVRIPKEFQLEGQEVEIRRRGDTLILRPVRRKWTALVASLALFTDDFMAGGRRQPAPQRRAKAFR